MNQVVAIDFDKRAIGSDRFDFQGAFHTFRLNPPAKPVKLKTS
jgi:hypothetical protein